MTKAEAQRIARAKRVEENPKTLEESKPKAQRGRPKKPRFNDVSTFNIGELSATEAKEKGATFFKAWQEMQVKKVKELITESTKN